MSIVAGHAARTGALAAGQSSTTTLALVGLGAFCLANPEKALRLLQKALLALSDGNEGGTRGVSSGPTPIVIHTGTSAVGGGLGGGGSGLYYTVLQLSVGAGLCWGSYALLINILPETCKNMLPVTQGVFKSAVTSLGKGLLHVKDVLSAEIAALLDQQSQLADKQDETHEQVLYVQDQVADVHDDVAHLQNSLDDCHKALQTTDKRTTYIAKGIRLVTQGMTAILPPDDDLVQELHSFQKSSAGMTLSSSSMLAPSARERSSNASQGSSGRRSRISANGEGRRRRNKPTNYDNLSVSTGGGTPVQAVEIPVKASVVSQQDAKCLTGGGGGGSIHKDNRGQLQELDEVRKLLENMEKHSRLAL